MFIHTKSDSINLNHISQVCWNFGIVSGEMVHTVVCISLTSGGESYLYYQDACELKTILQLKEKLGYPHDLPSHEETVSKKLHNS